MPALSPDSIHSWRTTRLSTFPVVFCELCDADVGPVTQHGDGPELLAQRRVRQPDHGHLDHGGVAEQPALDMWRGDVLAAAVTMSLLRSVTYR